MQEKFVRSNVDVAFAGGTLSPQDPESLILTPHGFVKFKDIKVGDEICGIENCTQTVTHIDPCGEKDFIRITLEDGSSARSAMDHKWWILKDGVESTVVSFELLESFQVAQEKGLEYNVCLFRFLENNPVPVRIKAVEDIGRMEALCIGVSNNDELYITDDCIITKNCGKAQPYSAKILTPKGWTTMGELKVNDVICDVRGGKQRVLAIYEKGIRDTYIVETAYGSTKACDEHLWRVWDRDARSYAIKSTHDIRLIDCTKYSIACPKEIEFNKYKSMSDFTTISPYAFGRILGKGTVDSIELSERTRAKLAFIGIKKHLFIPDEIKFAKLKERKEVMRGFVDESIGRKRLTADSWFAVPIRKTLLPDITFLVRSLGGDVMLRNVSKKFVTTVIYLPNLNHYYSRFKDNPGYHEKTVFRPIVRVKKAEPEKMRCILVSSPEHLYITDDFIVTHNTFAAILSVAEPSLDPYFRAAFTRRNLGNLKQGGGIVDDFRRAYGNYVKITTSDNPRISFPSGAFVDCLHIADETVSKLTERAKGWQYDLFYLDELTSYEFTTFAIVGTRNRGKGKWTGKIRGTTNPKRSHWTRKMLDFYIGYDGFVRKDRDGVVIYYYQMGDGVDDLVFGRSKREVYEICKPKIDSQLKRLNGNEWTYENLIRSFVFYSGKMSENRAVIDNNAGYVASVAAVGGKLAEQYIDGNFNVDDDEIEDIPISSKAAQRVFTNDPCRNNDKWVTVDLADVGSDNVVALAWDGFHVFDAMIITTSTPRMNYEKIAMFASRHSIPETHVIYDATHGTYMLDYMPEAIPFVSAASPIGVKSLLADRLKDECYLRLIYMISNQRISISEQVGRKKYPHKGMRGDHTIQAEFLDECTVVRIHETPRGKKKLMSKKEMNSMLGKNRSMDLLDPVAMRMYPALKYNEGDELDATSEYRKDSYGNPNDPNSFDVYDETNWQ